MTPLLLLWSAALLDPVTVSSLTVASTGDRTEILLEVDGPISVADFELSTPARIVLDLWPARHVLADEELSDLDRGGLRSLRVSQIQPEVVRVVAELERPIAYDVDQAPGQLRLSFANPGAPFDPWHAGPDPALLESPPISVYFRRTPILDVLATFAEFSGKSIIAGEAIEGTVTAEIRDQPWDRAFNEILRAHGLSAEEVDSGFIRVESLETLIERERQHRERDDAAGLHTRHFPIRFLSADSILPAIQGLLDERSSVTQNTNTNSLVVTAPPGVMLELEPIIQELDAPPPQVRIAAKIVFIDRSTLRQFGIAYDLREAGGNRINSIFRATGDPTDSDVVVELSGPSVAALANANVPIPSAVLRLVTTLVRGRRSLTSFVEALQEVSMSEIEAQPVITTLSHHEASVQVGERTPIRTIDLGTGPGDAATQPRATVDIQETGVILRATPHVSGDQVLLDLHAENSRIALAPSDIGFTFQTQEATTQVLLNDGETSIISGLTIVETSRVRTGVPILMDIPLLGALFRGTSDQESKRDLLIMVTPYIVREEG